MRCNILVIGLACCVLTTGCGSAKVDELTKHVEQLQGENARLNEELQVIQKKHDEMQQKVAQTEEIRKGYEEARVKFQEQLSGLASVLGAGAVSPLPPFEGLKNSEWVGKLMPGAAADLGKLKELKVVEGELLKGILGGQPSKP